MNDTSGPTSGMQFAYYDHDSHSWKMWPGTGLWGSIEFSETWPKTGCMSDGRAYELPTSVPHITANDSSSWLPTPSASDHKKVDNETEWTRNSPGLPAVSIHFPTLTVGNATGTNERRGGARSDEKLLPGIVLDFLPTPKANDFRDNNSPSESRRKDPALTAVSVYFPESTGATTDPLFEMEEN